MIIFKAFSIALQIEKTLKKYINVSRETLNIYTIICIFIQIKRVEFCDITTTNNNNKTI